MPLWAAEISFFLTAYAPFQLRGADYIRNLIHGLVRRALITRASLRGSGFSRNLFNPES
jgi:hypothetical protein